MINIKKENIEGDKKSNIDKLDNDEYNATFLVENDNKENDVDHLNKQFEQNVNKCHDNSNTESNLESDSDNSEYFEKLLKNAKVINISSFNKNEIIADKREKGPISIPTDDKHFLMALSFIHNFMIEHEFIESLEVFEKEYFKKYGDDINILRKGKREDILTQNELLRNDFWNHQEFTKDIQNSLEEANKKIQKTIKERDYYLMHHKRVIQEKETLNKEIQKQKKEIEKIQNSIGEIRAKYESTLKEKMLVTLEKEKRDTKIEGLNKYIERLKDLLGNSGSPSLVNISSNDEKDRKSVV